MLQVGDKWTRHTDYMTYALRDYALTFIDEAAKTRQPFLLIFAPHAPHLPAQAAPGDEALYPDLEPYRPPNYNEEDISDKPAWVNTYVPFTEARRNKIDADRRAQLQSLNALDQSVASLLDDLEQRGMLDNTMIIYLSDNGELWGEHRLRHKNAPYEPAIRIPMGVRYPPRISTPYVDTHLVTNLDIAPTLYALAGVEPNNTLDGLSLLPLLEGSDAPWRDAFVIEGWNLISDFGTFVGLHTEQYVYFETVDWMGNNSVELYDLEADPYQLQNQATNGDFSEVKDALKTRLSEFLNDVPADE
jgi:N-acetylglucosamine-6-sulfatase